jgi:hypothetical protein
MLAHEPFSDRADSVSSTIGAFLRTYNDGLDDVRRQDLYQSPRRSSTPPRAARRFWRRSAATPDRQQDAGVLSVLRGRFERG